MPEDCGRLGVESGHGAHAVAVVRGDEELIEDAVELSLAAGEPRACICAAEQPFKHTMRERSTVVEVCAHNHQHCRCAIEPCSSSGSLSLSDLKKVVEDGPAEDKVLRLLDRQVYFVQNRTDICASGRNAQ